MNDSNYNEIVPLNLRKRLNRQTVRLKLAQTIQQDGQEVQMYRYVIGLGERHFRRFDVEVERIIRRFPWTKEKHLRFVINELILNSQFSMLREVVRKVGAGKRVPGYFYLNLYINDTFASVGIEEFGDFFDYFSYLELQDNFEAMKNGSLGIFDESSEISVKGLNDLSSDNVKLILTKEHELRIPDQSNKIALYIIENATDHDFFISSFYKNGLYMWKRIHFRIDNIE